jgi:hypothetical protein
MVRWVLSLALLSRLVAAPGSTAAGLARSVREAGLDPDECYRVGELSFARDDLHFFIGGGYLIFAKAVNGARNAAVFSADADGDAELLVLPPDRGERMSLAFHTGSPNMDEHFTAAVLVFADRTYLELAAQIKARGAKRSPDMGRLLAEKWDGAVRNLIASVQVRLVRDLLAAPLKDSGLFYAALTGRNLGNFDTIYDPQSKEQIVIGQVVYRGTRPYYNVWTSFSAEPWRKGAREMPGLPFHSSDFRLDATLEPSLNLRVATRTTVAPAQGGVRSLSFEISGRIRVTSARIDGEPAEVFQPDSLRSNLLRAGDEENSVFLLVPPKPLDKDRPYEVEFQQEGNVISEAGNDVYYVGARRNWYPNWEMQFARYDLTFRYPKELDLVASGELVEGRTEGQWRIERRKTEAPVQAVAFNLGDYIHASLARPAYRVEVCANRRLEPGLRPKPQPEVISPRATSFPGANRQPPGVLNTPLGPPVPAPPSRLKELAGEIVSSIDFMTENFGPLPLRTVTVGPIPGAFGQGFAGLVYLSTLAYVDPSQRPLGAGPHERFEQTFYSEIMQAHEIAHQWWGNVVATADPRDDWLTEALANYSALLYLEKRKGPRAAEAALEEYRTELLSKTKDGKTLDAAGPIVWGIRLDNSQTPGAWHAILYAKGTWIIHMLRRRMGDKRFLAMLGELRRRYEYRAITTGQFRDLASAFMPPGVPDASLENFFDQWVYGTGIPNLKLNYSVSGRPPAVKLSGAVTQTEVGEDFSVPVPIQIRLRRGKPVTQWVRTGSEPATFVVKLNQLPTKVLVDPDGTVLAVKK